MGFNLAKPRYLGSPDPYPTPLEAYCREIDVERHVILRASDVMQVEVVLFQETLGTRVALLLILIAIPRPLPFLVCLARRLLGIALILIPCHDLRRHRSFKPSTHVAFSRCRLLRQIPLFLQPLPRIAELNHVVLAEAVHVGHTIPAEEVGAVVQWGAGIGQAPGESGYDAGRGIVGTPWYIPGTKRLAVGAIDSDSGAFTVVEAESRCVDRRPREGALTHILGLRGSGGITFASNGA